MLRKIKEETGVNIKTFDNRYHVKTKTGKRSEAHKYSDSLLIMLEKKRDGKPYDFKP